jgi:excisionase family DNA binding protein
LSQLGVDNDMKRSSAQTSIPFPIPRRDDPPALRGRPEAEPTSATLHELMTADQVAALLLLPASTVKDYARRGVLPSIKLGKHRRFVRSAVQAALEDLARRR